MKQDRRSGRRLLPGRGVASASLVVIGVGLLGACGGSSSGEESSGQTQSGATSTSDEVTIKTFAFSPDPLTVKAGTKVTWTNDDQILHTVTSGDRTYDAQGMTKGITPSGLFDLKLPEQGSTGTFTFTEPGTYPYLCTIHPGMDAQVVVN